MLRTLGRTFLALGFILALPVRAQYVYDPSNADERFAGGLRYFGSAKDDNGVLIPGVSIVIENAQVSFVFVTNELGRFRGVLPTNLAGVQMTVRCSKPGYQTVRVNKRPGPRSAPQPVMQLDCLMKAADAAGQSQPAR